MVKVWVKVGFNPGEFTTPTATVPLVDRNDAGMITVIDVEVIFEGVR
jgi:hypothetical protein